MIVALDSKGNKLNGWPFYISKNPSSTSALIGDINGDGNPDIIMPTGSGYGEDSMIKRVIFLLDKEGKEIDYPLVFPKGKASVGAVIGDIDNDGKVEIVAVSNDFFKGIINVWDLKGKYDSSTMEWPTYMHDNHLTGCYKCEEKTRPQSKIMNEGDKDVSGKLIIKIQKKSLIMDNWIDYLEVYNEIIVVPTNDLIKLDALFNNLNIQIDESGRFRVYVEFLEEEASYKFDVV